MQQIKRLERGCNILCGLKPVLTGGAKTLLQHRKQAVADLLHDRMTEMVLADVSEASGLFREPGEAFGIR